MFYEQQNTIVTAGTSVITKSYLPFKVVRKHEEFEVIICVTALHPLHTNGDFVKSSRGSHVIRK